MKNFIICGKAHSLKLKIARYFKSKVVKDDIISCDYMGKRLFFDGRLKVDKAFLPKADYIILVEEKWDILAKKNLAECKKIGEIFEIIVLERNDYCFDSLIEKIESIEGEIVKKTKVFLIGKSNSGKSTLFNLFADSHIAKVKDEFSTTRGFLHLDNEKFTLIDSFGYLSSVKDFEEWKATRNLAKKSDICIFVISCDQIEDKINDRIMGFLKNNSISFFILLNKADISKDINDDVKYLKRRWNLNNISVIQFSCNKPKLHLIVQSIEDYELNKFDEFKAKIKGIKLPQWIARITHEEKLTFKVYGFKGLIKAGEMKQVKRELIKVLEIKNAQPRLLLRTIQK